MCDRVDTSAIKTKCPLRKCVLNRNTARGKCVSFGIQRVQTKCPIVVSTGTESSVCIDCGDTLKFVAGDGINLELSGGALVVSSIIE